MADRQKISFRSFININRDYKRLCEFVSLDETINIIAAGKLFIEYEDKFIIKNDSTFIRQLSKVYQLVGNRLFLEKNIVEWKFYYQRSIYYALLTHRKDFTIKIVQNYVACLCETNDNIEIKALVSLLLSNGYENETKDIVFNVAKYFQGKYGVAEVTAQAFQNAAENFRITGPRETANAFRSLCRKIRRYIDRNENFDFSTSNIERLVPYGFKDYNKFIEFSLLTENDFTEQPIAGDNVLTDTESHQDEGNLINISITDEFKIFEPILEKHQVPEKERISRFLSARYVMGVRIKELPKWSEKDQYPELKELDPVAFLRQVHAASILYDHVLKTEIRDYDAALMIAVDRHIAQTQKLLSNVDAADGLVLMSFSTNWKPESSAKAREKPPTPSQTEGEAAPSHLPALPAGLAWPAETFSASPEHGKHGGLVKYLKRVWQPLIAAGYGERRYAMQLDPSVIEGITAFTRKNRKTGESRTIPEALRFLTIGEARRRRIASNPEAVLKDPRALRAQAYRLEHPKNQ